VNFHVNAGETVAIHRPQRRRQVGDAGHIMGFIRPDSGRVIVAHEDITDFPEAELRRIRRKVTMVFQSGPCSTPLTIAENILFSLELREDYSSANKDEVVDGLLRMVTWRSTPNAYPAESRPGTSGRWPSRAPWRRSRSAFCTMSRRPWWNPIMSDHMANLMRRLKQQLKLIRLW